MVTFIICLVIYLAIGVGLLVWACTDPWGGLLLEIWYLIVFLWPLMLAFSLWQNIKK